ncbi:uncharacterized protein LOC143909831 [Arctopsyche grandis]|uniref:uncharacterized protein LOC143909831 n=1 Tax=Arctopsyche grandis TaxID=121162 RepID=UPI00406D82D2
MWRIPILVQNKFCRFSGAALIEKLEEDTMAAFVEMGVIIKTRAEPFSIVIITSLMRRAHNLPCAKEIVFVDSTPSCDKQRHRITFVLTMSPGGATPLAVLISEGQTAGEYTSLFSLLKEAIGEFGFGGLGSPHYFMTDDSNTERTSLGNVFPNAKLLLCIFHIGQSVWRWLCNSKHDILKEDRPILLRLFKKIYSANNETQTSDAYDMATKDNISLEYSNWLKYISNYWERREFWCLGFRDHRTRGNHTNNYSEVKVRIFKEIILQRYKSFNAIIDSICTDMETLTTI